MSLSLRVLIVDDDEPMRRVLAREATRRGHAPLAAEDGQSALQLAPEADLVLLDLNLPDMDGLDVFEAVRSTCDPVPLVIVVTGSGEVQPAVRAMKMGAHEFVSKPFSSEEIGLAIDRAADLLALRHEVANLRSAEGRRMGELVGQSGGISRVREQISLVADSPGTTVLILGETGTGKELVARAIHQATSTRRQRAFVAVNCSAIQESLLESELFGYESGAFTDAKGSKKGLFEVADGGTLLLDEIGDMDVRLQAKILRVLESRTLRRLGGTHDLAVDVRVVAATHRDLAAEVEAGRFRSDLYFRLNVFPIVLPSLRERPEDVPLLAQTFLDRLGREMGRPSRRLSQSAAAALSRYPWPGNVRELKNLVERLLILHQDQDLDLEHLPVDVRHPEATTATVGPLVPYGEAKQAAVKQFDHAYLTSLMQESGGNVSEAARRAEIDRGTLTRLLRKTSIDPGQFR